MSHLHSFPERPSCRSLTSPFTWVHRSCFYPLQCSLANVIAHHQRKSTVCCPPATTPRNVPVPSDAPSSVLPHLDGGREVSCAWPSVSWPVSPGPSICGSFHSKPASGSCDPSSLAAGPCQAHSNVGIQAAQEIPPPPGSAGACTCDKTPSRFHSLGPFTPSPLAQGPLSQGAHCLADTWTDTCTETQSLEWAWELLSPGQPTRAGLSPSFNMILSSHK